MENKNTVYNAGEIFQFAIQIEQNGIDFYQKFAAKIDNKEARNIFTYLASEEVKHKEFFQQYLSKIETYDSRDLYPEEYFDYLKAFVDNIIFSKTQNEKEIDNLTDPLGAIEFAMRREIDSILYYYEIRSMVVENQQPAIDKIISEEKTHFATLSKLRDIFV